MRWRTGMWSNWIIKGGDEKVLIDLEVVLLFCLLASERKPTFLVDPLDCLLVLQILRIQYN